MWAGVCNLSDIKILCDLGNNSAAVGNKIDDGSRIFQAGKLELPFSLMLTSEFTWYLLSTVWTVSMLMSTSKFIPPFTSTGLEISYDSGNVCRSIVCGESLDVSGNTCDSTEQRVKVNSKLPTLDLTSLLASFKEIACILVFTRKLVLTAFAWESSNTRGLGSLGSDLEETEIAFNSTGFNALGSIDGQICLGL